MPRKGIPRSGTLLLTATIVLVLACSNLPEPGGRMISDSTYIEAISELISLKNRPGTDTAENAALRKQAMEKRGVTAEDLERKGVSLADDPARLADIWGKIRVKIGGKGTP